MKYLLVEVMERDISVPELFDTHEDAHGKMCELVAEACGEEVEAIKESFLSGEEFNEETVVLEDSAWTHHYGTNFDWKIFKLHDDGQIT